MKPYLEHVNITVKNPDAVARFLLTCFPEFKVRGEGNKGLPRYWMHIGTDDCYISIEAESIPNMSQRALYSTEGVNHLGFVVPSLAELEQRLKAAGYKERHVRETHPARLRMYFEDDEGQEYEFIEYLTDDRNARNKYE